MKTKFWCNGRLLKEIEDQKHIGFLPRINDSFTIRSLTKLRTFTHYGNDKIKGSSWVFKVKELTIDTKKSVINISVWETIINAQYPCEADGYVSMAMDYCNF